MMDPALSLLCISGSALGEVTGSVNVCVLSELLTLKPGSW